MSLTTIDSLVDALRGRPILRPEQFQSLLTEHAPNQPSSAELARILVKLKWLTVYQAKKILAGKADELVVGPYVVLDKLGEGGMGKVFKATQLSLNRVVALKVVRNALLKNETALKRFRREVKAAADLNHPNIVRVFDADQAGDKHFLAMEHIPGYDLAHLVKERGPLPVPLACSIVRQAAMGLQHAHDRHMVHRDIKPSNLLIASDGKAPLTTRSVVKILDMGLARMDTPEAAGEHLSTELTRSGTVIGTPDYMSPEQAKNSRAVDHRSDLYSLGCTFYYLLAGEAPFTTGNALEKLLQHQMDPPRPIQLLRMETPPEVATIVHCLLAKRPEDRFQSGAALAHALEPWCAGGPSSGFHAAPVMSAEAVDPSSATIDTMPADPFDFDSPTPPTVAADPPSRTPPMPTRPVSPRKPWLIGAGALAAVMFLCGAVAIAALAGKKKGDTSSAPPPPVAGVDPVTKVDPPRPKAKDPPPPAREMDSIERFLPNESAMVLVFDVRQWLAAPIPKRVVLEPLAAKLGGLRFLMDIDLMATVERVVWAIPEDDDDGAVVLLQGRALNTPKWIETARILGIPPDPAWKNGPDLYTLKGEKGSMHVAFSETSVIVSSERGQVETALRKREGKLKTQLTDESITKALNFRPPRTAALFATLGLKSGWAKDQPAAAKTTYAAMGVFFEERAMNVYTVGEESERGSILELQRGFADVLSSLSTDDNKALLGRVVEVLRRGQASPAGRFNPVVASFRVPNENLERWLEPFAALSK